MKNKAADQWDRREFLRGVTLAGTAGAVGLRPGRVLAEPPPETTRLRLEWTGGTCQAPKYVAEELLRAEGFVDLQYLHKREPLSILRRLKALDSGATDFDLMFVPELLVGWEAGQPIVVLAGSHIGCYELFGSDRVRAVRDLKNKAVAIREIGGSEHLFLASIVSYVGLDPGKDVRWVTHPTAEATRLLAEGKVDAVLGFPPRPQELRAKKIGHVILNSTTDRPWRDYFCCMVVGNQKFVHSHPIATKRVLRALLKANDVCARAPDRSAQSVVDKGETTNYNYALQTMQEIPYGKWREYDPEATVRFYALRLHEAGMIKSSPQKLIAAGTDWRFFNELKKELKG